ncbi:hypothetical protein F2P56_013749 [Juglans regia]|uniref:Uncharacterized protein n=1 Tax=Juglans regia TaxID=51240 RepID=A0A834CYK5_JUGRE|nr:hypothetical protein F2P56_013749 [Juglans regia]
MVDLPEDDDMIRLSSKAFKEMKRLQLFRCRNAQFSRGLKSLPNGIRVLDWPKCSLQSLPQFLGDRLVILRMPYSLIQEMRMEFKQNLVIMDFTGCEFLTKISDISSFLSNCMNPVEVHDFVGFLDKLVELILNGCYNLKSFPMRLQLRSLQFLGLDPCSSLQNFLEIEFPMEHLERISLIDTALIEELPSSIVYLNGLKSWDILEVTHEGTKAVKNSKLQMLTTSFEELRMKDDETFDAFYAKLNHVVNSSFNLGDKIPENRIVRKILRSLPERFRPKVTAIEESKDLDNMRIEELVGSLQTYEHTLPVDSGRCLYLEIERIGEIRRKGLRELMEIPVQERRK